MRWPACSFFGVFDGHGGITVSDFLRDQLHTLIVADSNFPRNPRLAIKNGCALAERMCLDKL